VASGEKKIGINIVFPGRFKFKVRIENDITG
jgi:hypothetical protein